MQRTTSPCHGFVILLLGALCFVAGPRAGNAEERKAGVVENSLNNAANYFIKTQSADGSWRSDTYAAFKDGTGLTPLVLRALESVPTNKVVETARAKGFEFLLKINPDEDPDLSYPLYTATNAFIVLSHSDDPKHKAARDAWVKYLRRRQLTEALDWQPADKEYGGWGYCAVEPRKPKAGEFAPSLTESNLSATLFAVESLRAAGAPADDPAIKKALTFVKRCQNFADDPKKAEEKFDDGGFFFIYDDPVRNKAGVAGKDASGRERFHSYGSVTADGLRALLACGLKPEDERVRAANRWLQSHFKPESHPGTYVERFELNRNAVFFYYSASLAQAWRNQGTEVPDGWASALAKELIKRQSENGSWLNPIELVRENDELTATSFAVIALGACRSAGAEKGLQKK